MPYADPERSREYQRRYRQQYRQRPKTREREREQERCRQQNQSPEQRAAEQRRRQATTPEQQEQRRARNRERMRRYRQTESGRNAIRRYLQSDLGRANARRTRARARWTQHGITPQQATWLLNQQSDACAIQGEPLTLTTAHIDHNHRHCPGRYSCGQCIRGLVCLPCNNRITHVDADRRLPTPREAIHLSRGHITFPADPDSDKTPATADPP